ERTILQDVHGKTYVLHHYPNRFIVLNYWASWCKPCYEEVAEVNAFYEKYKTQILLFGVNYDQVTPAKVQELATQMKIKFPVLANDPGPIFGIDSIPGLPITYIINPQGKVVKALYGKQTVANLALAIGDKGF